MQFSYQLSGKAEDDILESYLWYEKQKSGLGEIFLKSLNSAQDTTLASPHTFKIVFKKKVRAYRLTDFPFTIFYLLESNSIKVLPVFHTSRSPSVWKKRA